MADAIMISTLASELAGLASSKIESGVKTALNIGDAMMESQAKSIAEKARRSIMMYKVLLSAGIRDSELAGYITKYLENMYAIFTLITLGFNPMADDNHGIGSIVDSISAENFNENKFGADIQKRTFSIEMMDIANDVASGRRGPRIGKNVMSTEAKNGGNRTTTINNGDKITGSNAEVYKGDIVVNGTYNAAGEKEKPNTAADWKTKEVAFIDNVAKNNLRAYPTIISMKVNVGRSTVDIPIAIKANAYPVGSEELRLLIESGISGKAASFLRKMKWKSGEISTMSYIFNTDIAERDKKLYEKLGRNPWYVELQKRKAASKSKYWNKVMAKASGNQSLSDAEKEIANLQGYNGDIPPTASLIVTTDDLVAATRLSLSHFTKNEGFINKFMKESFLLAFGMVDLTAEQLTVFFMGYTSPFIISFADLKKESADPNKALYDAIASLSRKV